MSEVVLSIIIPTYNETSQSHLFEMAKQYPAHPQIEYIVVDSQTSQETLDLIYRVDFKIFNLPQSNRAERLNAGFDHAQGAIILFHHPRSLVEIKGIQFLVNNSDQISWGGLTHQFDRPQFWLRWTSWYSNYGRTKLFKIVYLDHCIYFRKEFLTKKIPNIPIFEDTELSLILSRMGRPKILPFLSITSAIRFNRQGFLRLSIINHWAKILYHMGASPTKINRLYEKNVQLNGEI